VDGIEEVLPYGEVSKYEQSLLDEMIPDLITHVDKGINFVKNHAKSTTSA
jgi:hypothetical protein